MGRDVFIDNDEEIIIKNNVCISQRVNIITGSHNYFSERFDYFGIPIWIGNNVWIAAGATILGGAQIDSHVFIGTGIVISKKIQSNTRVILKQNVDTHLTKSLLP